MGTTRICIMDGCGKPMFCRHLCRKHFKYASYHGLPLPPRIKGSKSQLDAAIQEGVSPKDDECVFWPFGRTSDGIAYRTNGFQFSGAVPREVCWIVNGPPPEPHYHAAHSCGNGHLGCVSSRHLSWKTPKENTSDKWGHGTMLLGETHPNSKFTDTDIIDIRASLEGGETGRSVAARYGVTPSTISHIRLRKTWRHIP